MEPRQVRWKWMALQPFKKIKKIKNKKIKIIIIREDCDTRSRVPCSRFALGCTPSRDFAKRKDGADATSGPFAGWVRGIH